MKRRDGTQIKPDDTIWITCSRPDPAATLRLFCFPYAGSGASIFRTWPNELPSDIEICPVQFPGRENRLMDPPCTHLEPLVQKLSDVLCPYLDKPFAFFGHSMGALVSFELARYSLQQYGLSPKHLLVSGHRAPQLPNPNPPIHHLPTSEFLEKLRNLNGTPEIVLQNEELMHLLLPILRADFAVCETFVYLSQEPLSCSLSAFGGLQDNHVSRDELMAWRSQTDGAFTLCMIAGNHFFLHSAREQLLQAISEDLASHLS